MYITIRSGSCLVNYKGKQKMTIKAETLVELFFVATEATEWSNVMKQAPAKISDKEINLLYLAWSKACKRRKANPKGGLE